MPTKLRSSKPAWQDADDAPPLGQEFFDRADHYRGQTLVRRGRGRPKGSGHKVAVNLRLDRAVVDRFRASGRGWQTRLNDVLAKAVARGLRPTKEAR